MFTPQMRSEYSPMHFPVLVCQRYNEVCAPLKCDLHDSSCMKKKKRERPKQKYDLCNFEGTWTDCLRSLLADQTHPRYECVDDSVYYRVGCFYG